MYPILGFSERSENLLKCCFLVAVRFPESL